MASLTACLLLASPAARAGSYSAAYSGGTYNGFGGQYGAPGTYPDSGGSGSEGGGGASCQGAISATLTWQPAYTGEPAPPSNSVIVTETSKTTSQTLASPSGSAFAKCDDGLGQPGSVQSMNGVAQYSSGPNPQVTGYFAQVSASDVRYTAGGGSSIPLSDTPTASMTPGGGNASVSYMASASPVTISLGGTTPVSGVQYGLTGQQITATLQGIPSGFTVTKYTWSTGGSTFKDYKDQAPSNQLVALGSSDLTGPASGSTAVVPLAFYDGKQENLMVTCTLSVTAPDGTSLSLTATAPQIDVKKPTAYWTTNSDDPTLGPVFSQSGMGYAEKWDTSITVPAPFSGGSGCFAQTVNPTVDFQRHPSGNQSINCYLEVPQNNTDGTTTYVLPTTGLDTYFPYQNSLTTNYPNGYTWDVSTVGHSGDFPQVSFSIPAADNGGNKWYDAFASDTFTTWLMYRPTSSSTGSGATIWVPLQRADWYWTGHVAKDSATGNWNSATSSSAPVSGSTSSSGLAVDTPPQWSSVNIGSNVLYPLF